MVRMLLVASDSKRMHGMVSCAGIPAAPGELQGA